MVCLYWYLDPLSPNQLKKNVLKVGPPLKHIGSAHDKGECSVTQCQVLTVFYTIMTLAQALFKK